MYLPGSKVIPMTNADLFLELQTQVAQRLPDNSPWLPPGNLELNRPEMKLTVLQNLVLANIPYSTPCCCETVAPPNSCTSQKAADSQPGRLPQSPALPCNLSLSPIFLSDIVTILMAPNWSPSTLSSHPHTYHCIPNSSNMHSEVRVTYSCPYPEQ